jgi:hypothetical protein
MQPAAALSDRQRRVEHRRRVLESLRRSHGRVRSSLALVRASIRIGDDLAAGPPPLREAGEAQAREGRNRAERLEAQLGRIELRIGRVLTELANLDDDQPERLDRRLERRASN